MSADAISPIDRLRAAGDTLKLVDATRAAVAALEKIAALGDDDASSIARDAISEIEETLDRLPLERIAVILGGREDDGAP